MRIITPENLHYPITVTRLLRKPQDQVDYNAPLFAYQYKTKVLEGDEETRENKLVERMCPSTFESTTEGTLTEWHISEGRVISRPGVPLADVEEACKHEVQFGNLCADCGKDMTTVTYNTITRDTARATVNAVHGHTSLLVSRAEASKSDEEAKRRLLSSRKLSLVVDLDQTIIQATVDPTVAEWQKDPQNPNYPAVKDVRAFQLIDDGPGARGCWYYIKLRPGLEEFLSTISKYYELHIYTMGTRTYAQNIAKIVDPDRKIFADRILSRDESGSLTVKNLKRLFPVDTKMVVIIDDRGDVWHWCHNLVKVTPYDFFVGIGDINSSFLPKRPGLEPRPSQSASPDVTPSPIDAQPAVDSPVDPTGSKVSAIDQLVSMSGGNDPTKLKEQTSEQGEAITAQLTDRPLLQKQKILDAADENNNGTIEASPENDAASVPDAPVETQKYRHNLLQDNDTELRYLQRSLQSVHSAFFEEYDRRTSGPKDGRVAELRSGPDVNLPADRLDSLPDVTSIMAAMKMKVLKGVHIVFSGVMPLGVQPQNHDFAIWAKSFGATVSENITKRTSHVVASPLRKTAKVRQAAKKADRIKIVSQDWLFACLVQWRKVDEGPFRLHADLENEPTEPAVNGQGSPFDGPDQNAQLSSSDEEAAVTEEEDAAETDGTGNDTDAQEQAELERYMPSLPREASSVETSADRADWDAELEEFLDGELDSESEAGNNQSDTDDTESLPSSARKRKRDEDGQLTDNDDDSDASQLGSSRLERRKRKALARTTSLASVSAVDDAQRVQAEAQTSAPQQDTPADIAEEDEDDDDLEAQMEAEMLRQAEEEGYA
ncbi:hypothetical protein QM012_008084 [Aureobasidium pullulans]|uniref:RNA polymerase II subunit A C-terminal domain phosphatase n=2 Tax=Aureobasidium TaxID=5579 RepID=A0ABR0TN01_AURPU